MVRHTIAEIVLENSSLGLHHPGLFCKGTRAPYLDESSGHWKLRGPGVFDFTTYFNGLSVIKLRRYTTLDNFHLRLSLKGGPCAIYATHTDALTRIDTPERDDEPLARLEASEDFQTVDVELPLRDRDVICGFMIVTEGNVEFGEGCYYALVDEAELRPVDLAITITTFKKEDYVLPNIELIRTDVLGRDDEIAAHCRLQVVDNGRTLDVDALSGDRVSIIPNDNTGGTGGFTRGMIEALEVHPETTHILLMDDDVVVSPESIRRTYRLLRVLNDEYAEAFVAGAMLDLDVPSDQWEDLGYLPDDGQCIPLKEKIRMTLLRDIVYNETFVPEGDVSAVTYAGWWYCCIPMATIRRVGLPLPLFVRYDDIEYSLRCQPRFITMNGLCVWHTNFNVRYSAAVERYETTRNAFICQMTTGMAPNVDFLATLHHNIQVELKKYNYASAELALDGFEDFLKGPDFIGEPVGERCFVDANRKAEKLVALDELQALVDADESIDDPIDVYSISYSLLEQKGHRSIAERTFDFATFNGQRTPLARLLRGGTAIIPFEGWLYPGGKLHNNDTLVVIDAYNHRGTIRHLDKARFNEVWKRYRHDVAVFGRTSKELARAYADARERFTSVAFWKHYLGMDA